VIKIGTKIVSHARYIAFQMAEVALPRMLFAEILRLIAELQPPPDPAPAGRADGRHEFQQEPWERCALMKLVLKLPTRGAPMLPDAGAHCTSWRGPALENAIGRLQARNRKPVIRRMSVG
jgi:hypothetical protein